MVSIFSQPGNGRAAVSARISSGTRMLGSGVMIDMFDAIRQVGLFRHKTILAISALFLLLGIYNIVLYFIWWIKFHNCVGPLNFLVLIGNNVLIAAGVLGIFIIINLEKLKEKTQSIYRFYKRLNIISWMIVSPGILLAIANLLGGDLHGFTLNVGVLSSSTGMTAIGVIGFLTAAALKKLDKY
jgi:hypothetical protein